MPARPVSPIEAREFHLSPQQVHQIVYEERGREAQTASGLPKVA